MEVCGVIFKLFKIILTFKKGKWQKKWCLLLDVLIQLEEKDELSIAAEGSYGRRVSAL